MALKTIPTSKIVLYPFLPWYLVQVALLLGGGFVPLMLAIALSSWIPLVLTAACVVWLLIEVRRFSITTISLFDDLVVCTKGVLRTQTGSFRRRRVDIKISRSFLGSLLDYGDVTFISEASQMTLHGIANLRVLEIWHAQQ